MPTRISIYVAAIYTATNRILLFVLYLPLWTEDDERPESVQTATNSFSLQRCPSTN